MESTEARTLSTGTGTPMDAPAGAAQRLAPVGGTGPASSLPLASVAATVHQAQQSLSALEGMVAELWDGTRDGLEVVHETAVHTIPRWHFAMLNDLDRNDAFATALERSVPPGAHVLDIGSGTGLLAMMAAKAGAALVTTCEANPLLAELARQIVARHDLSDVVRVVPTMSTDLRVGVELPRPADVIVSEIVDCGLIGEGVLPTVRHARTHLLAPDGVLLPRSATLHGVLVDSPAVDNLNRVRTAAGFDVRVFNKVATRGHFPVRLSTWPHRILSPPVELAAFDFVADPLDDGSAAVTIPVTTGGEAHALVAWFEMALCPGVVVHNTPDNVASHWMQACLPLPEPVTVHAGQTLRATMTWRGRSLSIEVIEQPENRRSHGELHP